MADHAANVWARLPLPCPVSDVADTSKWLLVAGDPMQEALELLRDLEPFIGYQASVDEEKERVARFLDRYGHLAEPQSEPKGQE